MPFHPGLPLGTRNAPTGTQNTVPPTSRQTTSSLTRDVGMSKNVTVSATFVAASNEIQAAGGTFANFAADDTVLVESSNSNNGTFLVLATDASTYLKVVNGVRNEGPVTVSIRAI